MNKVRTFIVMAVVMLAMVLGLAAFGAGAADHLDAPLAREDGRMDINDVYAFVNGDNTVLVMTVNPAAGVLSPTTLRPVPGDRYEFMIDNNGDYLEDIVLRVRAGKANSRGRQGLDLYWYDVAGNKQRRIASGNNGNVIDVRNGGYFFAGLRDDPFFFDLQAFRDQIGGAGGSRMFCDPNTVDFFLGFNTTAIVVELPSDMLTNASDSINIWAQTRGGMGVIDRMAKPALNTVFIDSANKDAYNLTHPSDDVATWSDRFVTVLRSFGHTRADARAITGLLLPDVLTLDTTSTAGFVGSLNGRQLPEDVIDFELAVVSDGAITSDCVNSNDNPFPGTFPYLADPN